MAGGQLPCLYFVWAVGKLLEILSVRKFLFKNAKKWCCKISILRKFMWKMQVLGMHNLICKKFAVFL